MPGAPLRLQNTTRGTIVAGRVASAGTFWTSFLGLMGRPSIDPDEGLWMPGVTNIHMFFMRFAIDCAFLGPESPDGAARGRRRPPPPAGLDRASSGARRVRAASSSWRRARWSGQGRRSATGVRLEAIAAARASGRATSSGSSGRGDRHQRQQRLGQPAEQGQQKAPAASPVGQQGRRQEQPDEVVRPEQRREQERGADRRHVAGRRIAT